MFSAQRCLLRNLIIKTRFRGILLLSRLFFFTLLVLQWEARALGELTRAQGPLRVRDLRLAGGETGSGTGGGRWQQEGACRRLAVLDVVARRGQPRELLRIVAGVHSAIGSSAAFAAGH